MTKRVIFDCDNTMGVPNCDVDDGLALMFLLECPDVELEGVCATYGNSTIDTVYSNTQRLFEQRGISVPLYKGGASASEPASAAASYLAKAAAENPGQIHVLATGSLTNLKGAALEDPSFFSNVASITAMGGITEPLIINGTGMDELNFSCDPEALRMMLEAPCPVTILTAQNCLDAYFSYEEYTQAVGKGSWLYQESEQWFGWMDGNYGINSYICWDVAAAAHLAKPEWFIDCARDIAIDPEAFKIGMLRTPTKDEAFSTVNTPRIANPDVFVKDILSIWKKAAEKFG